ncbi:dual adapter for phosphotyrosine and 3-phosphotyrosine and 3-phosphoinositide-like isoform X3 [Crassostrea virginica]
MSSDQVETLAWFHPGCDRHTAESLLLHNGVDGTYLLRPSSKPGDYALSVRCDSSVKHYLLTWIGTSYKFGFGEFESVEDLLHYFQNSPLIGSESGQLTELKFPYPRVVDEPNIYDTILIQAESIATEDLTREPDFSINSREGFLTKLGDNFKTWKKRWFVLQKNELRYHKDKSDKTPIRALNLDECSECRRDSSHKGKFNVFRMVFRWRTFYMYATTEQDCNDWVSLINWRLTKHASSKQTMDHRC